MPDSSTTAMTDSAAAKPKAGAAPTHPTSTPPRAGPLANATVRASAIRAADWAARLDQARRLKVGGSGGGLVADICDSLQDSIGRYCPTARRPNPPVSRQRRGKRKASTRGNAGRLALSLSLRGLT